MDGTKFFIGKTCQTPLLIAEHFPGTVTDFTTCSLPPFSVCTFDLLPKCDDVVTFYQIYLHFPRHFLFTSPSSRALFMYLTHVPSCFGAISSKICYQPYLCFYHTSHLDQTLQLTKTFLSCFFMFVVCRFCTSKQSFGYLLLDLARCVFVEVFVRD